MRTYLDCIPCFFKQALRAGRIATGDETKLKKLLDEIGLMLSDIPLAARNGNTNIQESKGNNRGVILSSGTSAPGTVLETCNAEFKEI